MIFDVTDELVKICESIVAHNYAASEWAAIESEDWVQSEAFEGGFDSDEMAFCFSYRTGSAEYWFQLTLQEIAQLAQGELRHIDMRHAEH